MKIFKCLRCGREKKFYGSQSFGKYCSIQCQHWMQVEQKMNSGDCVYGHGIRNWCYANLPQVCSECKTTDTWNGKPLRLQVDHIDGNTRNNRRENLRMLCPNCHTQTHNWGVNNASTEGVQKMKRSGCRTQKLLRGVSSVG